jgi:hypothetical protein
MERVEKPLSLILALLILAAARSSSAQPMDVKAKMEAINRALGVGCEFCHVPDDWKNTAKPPFATGQKMMQMVAAVNANQLAGIAGVACWTCHQGQRAPSRLPQAALAAERDRWPASLADASDRLKLTMTVNDVTLGVSCDHCHDPANWKSAEKPAYKMVARMNAMFDEFPKYMPATARTQCWMCHKGSTHPERTPPSMTAAAGGESIEQKSPGRRPPVQLGSSFDGLGVGMKPAAGTNNPPTPRNPSDNTIAVGRDRIVQIVNSQLAVFTKTGDVLYGPISTNTLFAGFGGVCEARPNGDAVVRYDQLADRWLVVMPIFRRTVFDRDRSKPGEPAAPGQSARPGPAAKPGPPPPLPEQPPRVEGARAPAPPQPAEGTYAICYAVSTTSDPLGSYYRYAFERPLFPDYPRPAIWPDGYYVPSSTGDEVIQKHACVAEREKMLKGEPAHEQCIVVDGVNFLNNADLDGKALPPPGAPNIVIAAGGTQLKNILDDDAIFVWKFHVDWSDPRKTKLEGPTRVGVAPYSYLCGGQLTSCVPQPGTERKLDAQGDKIMARVVYRNVRGKESIVATHSVNSASGGGGVRWYELAVDKNRDVHVRQQGTYAPDAFFRWMASPAIDRDGNIGIGYSFGGAPNFAGQRFAGRLAADPPGQLTFQETVVATGEESQKNTLRWEDYTQTAIDPSDDCTIWYVGDYLKKDAASYSTRIGSFRMPGCGGR